MKTNLIKFGVVSFVLLVVIALIAVTKVAAQTATSTATSTEAQVDATSTEQVSDATTTPLVLGDSTSTLPVEEVTVEVSDSTDTTSASETVAEDTSTTNEIVLEIVPIEAAPEGLIKVSIIGTKYIDYFTDGEKEYSFPGDAGIDAHLGEKDAPIPTHDDLTWVHTSGQHLYDTASGDLEEGQYALQQNGRYVAKSLPFVSSTSTPAVLDASTPAEPASEATAPTSTTSEEVLPTEQPPADTESSSTTQ